MIARQVCLDDWIYVKGAWVEYCTSLQAKDRKSGKPKIGGTAEQFRSLFLASLTSDAFFMFGVFIKGACRGVEVLQEFTTPDIDDDGKFVLRRHCFIRMVFLLSPGCGKLLDDKVVAWAKSRGHVYISGQCRPNIPARAAGRYGYRPRHVVMGKDI